MYLINPAAHTRRAFLRRAGHLAMAGTAMPFALNLQPTIALPGGRKYALNPNMKGLRTLFDKGQMAVQLNVGPLIKPLTRAQFNGSNRKDFPIPPKLFSHNDQQSVWQSSSP